jgi:hypothetical protein
VENAELARAGSFELDMELELELELARPVGGDL